LEQPPSWNDGAVARNPCVSWAFLWCLVQLKSVVYYSRGLTLCNDSAAVLRYRLTCPSPFSVVQLDRVTRQPSSRLNHTEVTVLQPHHNASINVAFCLSPDLLNYVHSLQFLEGRSPDGVELVRSDDSPQLRFELPLDIKFDNGSVQSVPLEATVIMPSLRLASDTLDFGVCFIGQPRELHVILSNPTDSDSYWQCKQGKLLLLLFFISSVVKIPRVKSKLKTETIPLMARKLSCKITALSQAER